MSDTTEPSRTEPNTTEPGQREHSSIGHALNAHFPTTTVIACHAWIEDQLGGAFKVASELAEHLAACGHRVCYVSSTSQAVFQNPTLSRGVELWRYRQPVARSPHPGNLWNHVRETFRVTRSIAKTSHIVCFNGHTPLQFLGGSLAAGANCPRHIYSVHSPFDDELQANWGQRNPTIKQRLGRRIAGLIERQNCSRATQVQTLSRYTLNVMRRKHPRALRDKGIVSPGWVDTHRFQPAVDRRVLRATLDPIWQTQDPLFFALRRLEPRMGLDRLIDAAGCLRDASGCRPFRLIIGGSGSLRGYLEQRVGNLGLNNCVFFSGRISDERLPDCYAAADCFVLPSTALECFGLIVLEAFACGTPVIGTPVGAIPELLAGNNRGWLTEGTDAGQIAARMREFLECRLKFDARSLRSIAESYDQAAGVSRLAAICLSETAVNERQHEKANSPGGSTEAASGEQ